MIIFPAIDIKDGNCVRLYKGDFSTTEIVADSYMDTAREFQKAGASWIHMVDLDGAKDAKPVNSEIFIDVAKNTGLNVELGGGIRNLETIEYYIKNGISRIILGSAALKNPQLVKDSIKEYGSERIAVGIDALGGKAAAEGWLDTSAQADYIELAKEMESFGVKYIIYTDISKDGTLSGINAQQLEILSKAVECNITASGGVHTAEDIRICKRMGLYGVICGKSIYKGTLDLSEALEIAEGK